MEYKRRRVSSALDEDINLVTSPVYTPNDIIERTSYDISTIQYYKMIFIEFIELICHCIRK